MSNVNEPDPFAGLVETCSGSLAPHADYLLELSRQVMRVMSRAAAGDRPDDDRLHAIRQRYSKLFDLLKAHGTRGFGDEGAAFALELADALRSEIDAYPTPRTAT